MLDPRAYILAAILLAAPGAGNAQGTAIEFGGLQQDPTAPIEVVADQLQVNQTDGTAIFTGNVVIGQGEMRLSAAEVLVVYAKAVEGGDQGKISRMEATGGVTIVNGTDAAEAEKASYSVEDGLIYMTGDVLLMQGENALTSEKMRIDLTNGAAIMEGRVKTVLQSGGN
ncbi:LptA/OstA family protein [Pseudogemmobacter sp. W21_MBD1_M6]|uniref:LptA/OstA family protein n=1 Tax=Pseudogemmobacter sp. W21_MBD1_M6 TaxID=3240271 RepID=UPI003F94C987